MGTRAENYEAKISGDVRKKLYDTQKPEMVRKEAKAIRDLVEIEIQVKQIAQGQEIIHIPYYIILKKSGLHPFVVRKTYYQCNQFSFSELKKIYQKIFKIDFNIKTGKIEPGIGLDLLIAEI